MSTKKLYALTDSEAKLGREIANLVSNLASTSGESGGVARCRDVADALATPIDTDAAVERMARAVYKARYEPESFTWAKAGLFRESYREDARAALAALLGGEQA